MYEGLNEIFSRKNGDYDYSMDMWRMKKWQFLEIDLSLARLLRNVSVWKQRKTNWKASKTDEREKIFCISQYN